MKRNYIFSNSPFQWVSIFVLALLVLSSCKKAVDVGPSPVSLTGTNVYTTNGSAESVLSGLFSKMAVGGLSNGSSSISLTMGLAADELVNYDPAATNFTQFYTNNLNSQSTYSWPEIYKEIYVCNTAITGLSDMSTSLYPLVRQQLTGEAKFTRAFLYFYATNQYGDVPLTLTNYYITNNTIARSPQSQVYTQVIQDLKDAQGLLSDNKYVTGTGAATAARVRPNQQTASALLARVYLYQQDWVNAETQSTNVINSSSYLLEPNLNQVFLATSHEAIWQLEPVIPGNNSQDATNLIVNATPGSGFVTQLPLNSNLVNAFEPGDTRFTNWVGQFQAPTSGTTPPITYYYAFKYKVTSINPEPLTEYIMMFRLAEQYLIRAEARVEQGNVSGAQSDLNIIRARAGLPPTTASSKADLLTAIAHERQVELFTEWGHRWFDLKRTNTLNAIMSVVTPQKGGVWNVNKQLLPLPNTDILADPQLKQNPGY